MSAAKSAKAHADVKSRAKSVLATLERISGSSSPDKEQTRYLCHKLLNLVNDQEASKKDVTSKAGLDIILLTLESCSDQATCLALVSTLAEIASGGKGAIKRLISHDASRVLLHTLSYIGTELDWRLLSGIIHLLAIIAPKDRRFALRARLTGSLSMILTAVRSSHNHTSRSKLLPAALSVLKTSLINSSTNASLLGRAGAVYVVHRIVISLSKKQGVSIRNALASLNLLVRFSKVNATRAVKLGVVAHLLSMHQDYHKHDFKHNRHTEIRKSVLNTLKNIALLKAGRKAFLDANGLHILHKSCKDYLEGGHGKSMESLLIVAIMIVRRCQPKTRLPVVNSRCTFQFSLPGGRERSNSMDSCFLFDESDDDFDENEDNLSADELDDGGEATQSKRRASCNSISKGSATSDSSKDSNKSKPIRQRSFDDLKMYDTFFPELQLSQSSNKARPHASVVLDHQSSLPKPKEVRHSLPDLAYFSSTPLLKLKTDHSPHGSRSASPGISKTSADFESLKIVGLSKATASPDLGRPRRSSSPRSPRSSNKPSSQSGSLNYSSGDDYMMGANEQKWDKSWKRRHSTTDQTPSLDPLFHFSAAGSSKDDSDQWKNISPNDRRTVEQIQKLASLTKSAKESVNTLSRADAWGCKTLSRLESQANKKSVQRLIKTKVLEDVSRTLFPDKLINKLVYSSDQKVTDLIAPRFETAQLLKCDVVEPVESQKCPDAPNNLPNLQKPRRAEERPSSSLNKNRFEGKLVVNVPTSQDFESSSTSISDDTWPGVYLDKESLENITDSSNSNCAECSNSDKDVKDQLPEIPANSLSYTSLKFDSHFESGNLRSAVQVREYEYDLVLNPDCNSNHHFQWFYFEVSQMRAGKPYRFNIVNCEKKGSVINEGMQPVMYSMSEARLNRPYWVRVGRETCYYRNHFLRNHTSAGGVKGRTYFTLTFTVTFRHTNDICYFAYHYPYTYTKLQLDLQQLTDKVDHSTMFVRNQVFCHTLGGNPVPVLTITAPPKFNGSTCEKEAIEEMNSRPYIFLSARVHPGESNASWTMRGTLRLLLTPPPREDGEDEGLAAIAHELRRSYIFKIVPMLNPDGVINGHHRCSLSGEDLNRTWSDPNPDLFPTIYHTKGLLQYLQSIQKAPLVYCDYHGHSRRMNVFLYGCSRKESVAAGESSTVSDGPDDTGCKSLPKLLAHFATPFSFKNCSFVVEKAKVSTARVVVWKEIGVARSYTMESTYCGCDQGPLRGKQIGTRDLEAMGSKFCEVLLHLKVKNKTRSLPVYDSDDEKDDTTSQYVNEERDNQISPGCPVNSDAELTPDEDLFALDEAYGVPVFPTPHKFSFRSALVSRDPTYSDTNGSDMTFWRYEESLSNESDSKRPSLVSEASFFAMDDAFPDLDSTLTSSNLTTVDSTLTSNNPGKRRTLEVIAGRVSPVSGRVVCSDDERLEVRTAPRPFESGLMVRKAPPHHRLSLDETTATSSNARAAKWEAKSARVRRRLSRQSKE